MEDPLEYEDVIGRVEAAASEVAGPDSEAARRVLSLARQLAARERVGGSVVPLPSDAQLKRELNRHFELLGRRGAKALPVAALARALLADLAGSRRDVVEALSDCDRKLSMFGL